MKCEWILYNLKTIQPVKSLKSQFMFILFPFPSSPMHYAIMNKNEPVFSLLLAQSQLNLELQNAEGETALWLALQSQPHGQEYSEESFAARLIARGSSPNATNSESGKWPELFH